MAQVVIDNMSYSPDPVNIAVGETVTWVWHEDNHSTTSDDGLWESGVRNSGGLPYSHTFPDAGSFGYHCSQHPGMTGTVVVGGGAAKY